MKKLSLQKVFEGAFDGGPNLHPEVEVGKHRFGKTVDSPDPIAFVNGAKQPTLSEEEIYEELFESVIRDHGLQSLNLHEFFTVGAIKSFSADGRRMNTGYMGNSPPANPRSPENDWMFAKTKKSENKLKDTTKDDVRVVTISQANYRGDKYDDEKIMEVTGARELATHENDPMRRTAVGKTAAYQNPKNPNAVISPTEDELQELLGFKPKALNTSEEKTEKTQKEVFKLKLKEWMDSSWGREAFSKIARDAGAEFDFFKKTGENEYLLNTEKSFKENQNNIRKAIYERGKKKGKNKY